MRKIYRPIRNQVKRAPLQRVSVRENPKNVETVAVKIQKMWGQCPRKSEKCGDSVRENPKNVCAKLPVPALAHNENDVIMKVTRRWLWRHNRKYVTVGIKNRNITRGQRVKIPLRRMPVIYDMDEILLFRNASPSPECMKVSLKNPEKDSNQTS